MLINLRNALMAGKRLPYDAEVEYLECAGTSSVFPYINTGIVGDSNTTYEAMLWRNTQTTNECAIGSWNRGNTRCWIAYYFSNEFYLGVGAQVNSAGTPQPNVWHKQTLKIESSNFNLYVDDELTVSVPQTTFTSDQPLYIGAMNSSGTASFYFRGRFGAVKIYQNGVLVRDYIPVRRGTVGYLYDRVSGKLFGNAGTGDFVLGPDVVPVEYIESHGTEYINTGIKPSPSTSVETVFAMTTFTANCGLFGARGAAAADSKSYNLFIINNSGARVRWDWSGSGNYQTSQAETSTAATYILGAAGGNITRDGTTVMAVSSSKTAIDYPLYVFNMNNVGSPFATGANARFWSVKIYDGQTLGNNFLPVRVGTEGAMMDVLTRRIYRNAGTGAFTYGNDLKYPIPQS